jgi:hypothetical protein
LAKYQALFSLDRSINQHPIDVCLSGSWPSAKCLLKLAVHHSAAVGAVAEMKNKKEKIIRFLAFSIKIRMDFFFAIY